MNHFSSSLCISVLFKRFLHHTQTFKDKTIVLKYGGKCFDGELRFYNHSSDMVKCKMNFAVYLPPKAIQEKKDCPVLYFLNGRTANHENFVLKSGFQILASRYNICVVSPDTSPRGVGMPDHDYLGTGASFYLDAIEKPWVKNYQMFSYVTKELIEMITANFPIIKGRQSISGLSMGGYGALNCFLKSPGLYQSISVFAPICNPMATDLGRFALKSYLGQNKDDWKAWNPCELVKCYRGDPIEILIEQGTNDCLYKSKFLLPEDFIQAAKVNKLVRTTYRKREGYDHSHYFVATFIDGHMEYHANKLNCK